MCLKSGDDFISITRSELKLSQIEQNSIFSMNLWLIVRSDNDFNLGGLNKQTKLIYGVQQVFLFFKKFFNIEKKIFQ